ncbi:hypothetical protein [Weissella halotolerans]|nr:hypothetical protein [Weissella halotolerans]
MSTKLSLYYYGWASEEGKAAWRTAGTKSGLTADKDDGTRFRGML